MKYWFDTEFIDDGKIIDLVSIGIVAEDGKTFYVENQECDHSKACEWVKENVNKLLTGPQRTRIEIRKSIEGFIGHDTQPEIWAYYGAYDWVVLCQLFGRMLDLPKNWPHLYFDVKYLAGARKLPEQVSVKHHALNDAIWTKDSYYFLMGLNENH